METYNIHETKTQLSALLARVNQGESFIIAKAGKPIARLVPYEQALPKKRPVGFLKGKIKLPENFDSFHQDEIIGMFEGKL